MQENSNLFDAAIVNEEGIIKNVLVFNNEDTMHEFGAKRLAKGQGIGDVYKTPEEYEKEKQQEALHYMLLNSINEI